MSFWGTLIKGTVSLIQAGTGFESITTISQRQSAFDFTSRVVLPEDLAGVFVQAIHFSIQARDNQLTTFIAYSASADNTLTKDYRRLDSAR